MHYNKEEELITMESIPDTRTVAQKYVDALENGDFATAISWALLQKS
jgi:hypothetical protein